MVISLERGADLHMAQLLPLPLTVSCFSKIQIGFTSLVLAYQGSPGKGPLNGCVCVAAASSQSSYISDVSTPFYTDVPLCSASNCATGAKSAVCDCLVTDVAWRLCLFVPGA